MSEDYYALLGVEPDASEEAILRAYREKAAEHHPDVSEDADAGATFQRLNRAKDVLTDAERRREYDRVGHDRFVEGEGDSDGATRTSVDVDRGTDISREAVSWPSGLGAFFEQLFGGRAGPTTGVAGWRGGRQSRRAPADVDLRAHLRGAESAKQGGSFEQSSVPRSTASTATRRGCPKCGGRGTIIHDIDTARGRTRRIERCEACGGSGTVVE